MAEWDHEVNMGCDVEVLDGGMELGMDYMGVERDGKELEMGGKEEILASNHVWHLVLATVLDR